MVFQRLRQLFGIDNMDYLLSLTGDTALRLLASPGKSGSAFFLSDDDRFLIKTVQQEELRLLLELIPKYYRHVEENSGTLLTRFHGLHMVKPVGGAKATVSAKVRAEAALLSTSVHIIIIIIFIFIIFIINILFKYYFILLLLLLLITCAKADGGSMLTGPLSLAFSFGLFQEFGAGSSGDQLPMLPISCWLAQAPALLADALCSVCCRLANLLLS